MNTKQQTDKLRRYLTGQIRSAVENEKGCIGTYYKNRAVGFQQWLESGGDKTDEYTTAPVVVLQNNWFDTPGSYGSAMIYDLYISEEDGGLYFTAKLDNGDCLDQAVSTLQLESLQQIINWLQEAGFVSRFDPAPITLTSEFWDFIKQHLPDYHTRYDVYRQGELQLFIDDMDGKDLGITKEEAREERDHLLFHIFAGAIDAFTRLTPEQEAIEAQLNEIARDEYKQECFGEILLNEVIEDYEPYHKIVQGVIDAYLNRDCDAMLISICGWTMQSLVEKTTTDYDYRKPYTNPH